METIFLYGPPGAGKSTLGRLLAERLNVAFTDLDDVIVARAGRSIPQIFADEGEAAFRLHELKALRAVAGQWRDGSPGPVQIPGQVVALGGGALLAPAARQAAESAGVVVCLQAQPATLLARLQADGETRPLLQGDAAERLMALLEARAAHYQSFPRQVDTSQLDVEQACWQAQVQAGRFHVRGMGQGYDVVVRPGVLAETGRMLSARGLKGPLVVVSDENVAPRYAGDLIESLRAAGYTASQVVIPPGEAAKTIDTIQLLWAAFVEARLERSSTVLALGGGVVGDMTGFAAATFLRGINWVNLPTTLLSMVDSSLGGKTGIDLPQGKNLVGAFYPPRLVLADPAVLGSLPESELRNGLAETVKHGVIADPDLFARCGRDWAALTADLDAVARQGMAVKVKVIEVDPYEQGLRQALNLGHTVGHGVELASDFQLSHGQAVAIGMVVETRLAEACGVAAPGLSAQIVSLLEGLGLPVAIPPGLDPQRILAAMNMDKKRAAGKQRFALPEAIGAVRVGVEIEDWQQRIFL
jgi:shikimate kinase / 3-dehydroquinate synthase